MTDIAGGPDWWLAGDGKWYPPELHPEGVELLPSPPAPLPAPPTPLPTAPAGVVAFPTSASAHPGASPPQPPMASGTAQHATTTVAQAVAAPAPNVLSPASGAPYVVPAIGDPRVLERGPDNPAAPLPSFDGFRNGSAGPSVAPPELGMPVSPASPAGPGEHTSLGSFSGISTGAPASGRRVGGFDENPFSHRSRGHLPPVTRKRSHASLPLITAVIVVVVGVGSAIGYFVTHPSPHRSATSAALDFYENLGAGRWTAAAEDVEPTQRSPAEQMASASEVQAIAKALNGNQLSTVDQAVQGSDITVTVQVCNATFSCHPAPVPVPVVDVNGSWYVDWTAWDLLAKLNQL